jgi:hypothetical protein
MSYKDRECYLGASEKLGYLDKGGKWRNRDWWQGENGEIDVRIELSNNLFTFIG